MIMYCVLFWPKLAAFLYSFPSFIYLSSYLIFFYNIKFYPQMSDHSKTGNISKTYIFRMMFRESKGLHKFIFQVVYQSNGEFCPSSPILKSFKIMFKCSWYNTRYWPHSYISISSGILLCKIVLYFTLPSFFPFICLP